MLFSRLHGLATVSIGPVPVLAGRMSRRALALKSVDDAEHAAKIGRRRRRERIDSVDPTILADREDHAARISEAAVNPSTLSTIRALDIGRGWKWHDQKKAIARREGLQSKQYRQVQRVGKCSVGMPQTWERLNRDGLPEVAILGHSNSGKSALLNALCGEHARTGPAEVSPRAGWTADLHFYRASLKPRGGPAPTAGTTVLRPPPPHTMMLVDTPGYGFSVGSHAQLQAWGALLADYLDGSRRLALALMLVDCTRGFCAADVRVLARVRASGVPVLGVMTKGDLLSPEELAASHGIVAEQMASAAADGLGTRYPGPVMVSAHFYTGFSRMWDVIRREVDHIEERRAEKAQEAAERQRLMTEETIAAEAAAMAMSDTELAALDPEVRSRVARARRVRMLSQPLKAQ